MKIKIEKIDEVKNPRSASAGSVQEYRESLHELSILSPNIGYWLEGEHRKDSLERVYRDIEENRVLVCLRYSRNGVEATGIFQSSKVESVKMVYDDPNRAEMYIEVATQNSKYIVSQVCAVSRDKKVS